MGKIIDFTQNGKCSNCGNCCTNLIVMSDREVNRIKVYLRQHPVNEQFLKSKIDIKSVDMTCPFRDHVHGKCLIYSVRPEICKQFICNKDEYSLLLNRNKLASENRRSVFMRTEFFGNKEDINFFNEIINPFESVDSYLSVFAN